MIETTFFLTNFTFMESLNLNWIFKSIKAKLCKTDYRYDTEFSEIFSQCTRTKCVLKSLHIYIKLRTFKSDSIPH